MGKCYIMKMVILMGIDGYIKKYGHLTFQEKEFNEVDNVILTVLSYIDFDGIIEDDERVPLREAGNMFFKRYDKKEIKTIFSTKAAIEMFKEIKDTRRYGDLILYDYVYKRSDEEQFCALTIDIDDRLSYISFEGTDELISGWAEDAAMSYKFPVPAQKDAIKYVNHIPLMNHRKYILGGHSKGGNLALVAGMYTHFWLSRKIIKIYSNDGPGLRNKEYYSHRYKRIEDIYELIIPKNCIVGLFLHPKKDKHVIDTLTFGPITHCTKFWTVEDDHFKEASLSHSSEKLDAILTTWLETYNYEEREEFINNILEIFKKCNIDSLLDIKETKLLGVINILKESTKLDKKSKDIILSLLTTSIDMMKKK